MKKIVVLTGAGMSAESGLKTFRDADGLWENYPVQQVATHEGWLTDPTLVTEFYNMLRGKLNSAQPNEGHLHERAGSSKVIHLHGELMKVCSSRNTEDTRYWQMLTADNSRVEPGTKAGDGSLLRPYIVFFGEAVPRMEDAVNVTYDADIFIIIGSSLVVYPAAGLVRYVKPGVPVYLIDPADVNAGISRVHHIQKGASAGMKELYNLLMKP